MVKPRSDRVNASICRPDGFTRCSSQSSYHHHLHCYHHAHLTSPHLPPSPSPSLQQVHSTSPSFSLGWRFHLTASDERALRAKVDTQRVLDDQNALVEALTALAQHLHRGGKAEQVCVALRSALHSLHSFHSLHTSTSSTPSTPSQLDEAGRLYEEALSTNTDLHGTEHLKSLTLRSNLGVLRGAQGHLEKSEALLRGSLKGLRSVAGAHHSLTLLSSRTLPTYASCLGGRRRRWASCVRSWQVGRRCSARGIQAPRERGPRSRRRCRASNSA